MSEHHRWKSVQVTVSDPETGTVLEQRIVDNDYCLITTGNRYVKSLQIMGKPSRATHMIAVAIHPPGSPTLTAGKGTAP